MKFFKLILLICSLTGCSKSEECIVNDQKTNSEKPCAFPFIINGKIYYGCTTDFSETEGLACSTKTNSDNEHIEGEIIFFSNYICIQNTKVVSISRELG